MVVFVVAQSSEERRTTPFFVGFEAGRAVGAGDTVGLTFIPVVAGVVVIIVVITFMRWEGFEGVGNFVQKS